MGSVACVVILAMNFVHSENEILNKPFRVVIYTYGSMYARRVVCIV